MPGEVMDGAQLMGVINKNRDGFYVMEVAAEQLDSISDVASSNIGKNLKQALLRFRKLILTDKQEHDKLMVTTKSVHRART